MPRYAVPARRAGEPGRVAVVLVVLAGALSGCAGGDGEPTASGDAAASATALADPADLVTNGVDRMPAAEVIDRTLRTLSAVSSYRVSGSPTPGSPLDLVFVTGTPASPSRPEPSPSAMLIPARPEASPDADPAAGLTGRGVRGTLTRDGSTFEMLAVDGQVYVRGNLDWLAATVGEDARRTLGDKWLLLPESLAQELATVTDPDAFASSVLEPTGAVQDVGVSTVDGTPAVGIRYVDTEATAWVAGVGPVLPLLVERLGATATDGVLRFSDIDAAVTLTAPGADDVLVVPDAVAAGR